MSLASYLLILSLLFWFFHILRRTLFYLYFGQLKEYRLDRIIDGMRENRRILFPRNSIVALILFLISIPLLRIPYIFEVFFFILYFFLACYSFNLILKKDFPLPKFTKKMILLSAFILLLEMFFVSTFYSSSEFFRIILIFEVFFPFLILLAVLIFQLPIFTVKRALIIQAKNKIKKIKNLTVIGITGSYGKTSTKEFLIKLLEKKFFVLKTEGNRNSEIGVVETILSWSWDIVSKSQKPTIFVCEMGAYKKGEIKAICDIVKPQIGILTGISEQHISLFGNLKNIINTKYELINSLPKTGIAIFNGSNKECLKLYQRAQVKKYIYSTWEGEGDAFSNEIKEEKDFLVFKMTTKSGQKEIRLNLLGKQNIENFLGAALCALLLGIPLKDIKETAGELKPSFTAMTKREGKNGVAIIDDSYSQNPDGVATAIDYLKNYQGKKVVVMPCLIELGKSAPSAHKNLGQRIGEVCDLLIITTPYFFEELKLGAIEAGMKKENIFYLNYPITILKKIEPCFHKENVILIEGRVNEQIKNIILK